MNRRFFPTLLLVFGLVFGVGGYYYYVTFVSAPKLNLTDADLAAVRRGTLIATVNATGSVEPTQQAALAFQVVGNVAEVSVKPGDQVKAGQALARLETRELELQLAQAEANLSVARTRFNQLAKGPSADDLATAQQNLASAQAAYDKLLNLDPNELKAMKTDIDKAKALLDQAQAAYDHIGGDSNPLAGMSPQRLQLQAASLDYQKALALYNNKINPSNAQIQQALAAIQSAKAQIARLKPAQDDLDVAQANVRAAQAARDLAAERINQAKLVAPFDGTVIRADLDTGGFVSAGRPVITVADLSHLRVTINIDETDIPRVSVGLPVDLDFDAFPNLTITGSVSEIASSATIMQGVVNYTVKVNINPIDANVKLGMTANANIQVAQKDNVLLVPNRAIRALNNNRRIVSVYDGLQLKEVGLKLGMSNDQETEVLAGLEEGQRVVVTALPTGVPGFGR